MRRSEKVSRAMRIFETGVAVAIIGAATTVNAQQNAHVHGVGQLNIAIESDTIEMELIAPGADIVGFEHEPETDDDRAAVAGAVDKLRDGLKLFAFPESASCEVVDVEVKSPLNEDHDEHEHEDENEGPHAEFLVHYHMRCANIDALSHMDVLYFEHFPNAQELEVQVFGDKGQTGAELSAGRNRHSF